MKPTALLFTSERELPRNDAGQWNSCRIVSVLSATALATRNECFLRGNARYKGLKGRVSLAVKGLRGADGNWRQDSGFSQADVDEVSRAMFPDLPMPTLVGTTDWWSLISHLPDEITEGSRKGKYTDGHAISISLRLSVLSPGDDARKWTAADHQVVLRARRERGGVWWGKRIDPMRPQKDGYQGDWVRMSSLRKAAMAINGGVVIAELYPMDEWTSEALMRKRKNAALRAAGKVLEATQEQRDKYKRQVHDLEGDVEVANTRIARLEVQLKNGMAAGWESALVQAGAAIDELRTQGPEVPE